LIERQQAPLLAGDGDAGHRMRVQDADRVMPRGMDRAVNREAGRVDAEAHGVVDDVSVEVDRHQVGRRDFLEAQAIGIDEEAVLPARKPGGDVRVDAVVEDRAGESAGRRPRGRSGSGEFGLPPPATPLRCFALHLSFSPLPTFNVFSLRATCQ
jgi:hypothetical protein